MCDTSWMRVGLLLLGLFGCGCQGELPGDASRTDAGAGASEAERFPPAPDTPGCAMTIDGEAGVASTGAAELTYGRGVPSLKLWCGEVQVEVYQPKSGEIVDGTARFSRHGAEYRGPCDVRLDKLAIRDRGGLAARVVCELSLIRVLSPSSMAHPPLRRIEGHVVMPKATDVPDPPLDTDHRFCTYETTGEYTLTGRGHATAQRCFGGRVGLEANGSSVSISHTFCPTCGTTYVGTCTTSNIEERGGPKGVIVSDVACDGRHELAGAVHVKAHIEGSRVLVP